MMQHPVTIRPRRFWNRPALAQAMAETSGGLVDTRTARPPTSLEARVRAIARAPLFSGLTGSDLEALAQRAQERPMRSAEILFRRGDQGSGMLVILEGEVRITVASPDGREQVLRLLGPGDVFGEIALLDGRPRTADATAMTNGRLLSLERRDLLARVEQDAGLALRLIAMLCERLRTTSRQLETLQFDDLPTRLAATLISLTAGRAGSKVDITQAALGAMVGASRETVNKRLRDWQRSGWVELTPGRIRVRDVAALALLAPTDSVH